MTAPAEPRGGEQRIPRPVSFVVSGPAPWSRLSSAERHLTLDRVRERCATFAAPRPEPIEVPGSRDAAVLIPLFEEDGAVHVVLTKRPETMPSHQGEIAFPGGTVHPGLDASPRDTALREAHEEIGLDPADVEVVAALDRLGTVGSRFLIDPFVGLLAARPELRADPREVVRVFDVPLAELLDDSTYREEHWSFPVSQARPFTELDVVFFELIGETVWGATARILRSFLARLLDVEGEGSENRGVHDR
jgi:8-oxo-dGTP pyrophosphatase MutT (NUDIX family)